MKHIETYVNIKKHLETVIKMSSNIQINRLCDHLCISVIPGQAYRLNMGQPYRLFRANNYKIIFSLFS